MNNALVELLHEAVDNHDDDPLHVRLMTRCGGVVEMYVHEVARGLITGTAVKGGHVDAPADLLASSVVGVTWLNNRRN